MAVKSSLFARQLLAIFGEKGEGALQLGLQRLAAADPDLAGRLQHLFQAVDGSYLQYGLVSQVQSELSGDVLSDWNLQTGTIDSGKQWKVLLGYRTDELDDTLSSWQRLVHPDDLPGVKQGIAAHVRGDIPYLVAECRLKTRQGSWCQLLVRGKVTTRDERGEPLRMLVMHRDQTQAKTAEAALLAAKDAAEAANRARGAFLANVSHEIRTPLNGVLGMTELALDTPLDGEQRHYLRTVKSSAESLLALLNDVLDFSKIEAGKLQFESISFAPASVLQDAVRSLAVGAQRKGLELVVEVGDGVSSRVLGDPSRLRQVLLNLLGNAIKFTAQGEIEVRVEVARREVAAVYLQFSVRDTGIGIAKEKQALVFDAFSQADVSTTRRFGGTGLGLAICSRLVQLMDGRIWLESVEGRGSVFFFTARFGLDREFPAAEQDQRFRGLRALVMDDNEAAGRGLARCLAILGVQTSWVPEVPSALDAMYRARELGFPYQFVFADAGMSAPGGLALVETWRQGNCPEKLVLLLTHEHTRQGLDVLQQQGRGSCLLKPVVLEDVVDVLVFLYLGGNDGLDLAPINLEAMETVASEQLRVLLVEDNLVNQELARRILEKLGHRVTLANHGGEALDMFEQHHFDVIIMDMQMPVMGGLEATEAIRARELRRSWVVSGEFRPVPIIAMTANAMAGDRERCLGAGMNDYLAKPIRSEEVKRVLAALKGSPPVVPARFGNEAMDLVAAEQDIGDRELLVQMAGMLLDEWNVHLGAIRSSISGRDGKSLQMQAHTVKSLVAIFHANRARKAALALEQSVASVAVPEWVGCEALASELFDALAEIRPPLMELAGRAS